MSFQRLATVSDYMDTVVQTLHESDTIDDAINKLLDQHVTGAPVIDDENHVIGMFTEKDCLKLLSMGDAQAERATGIVGDYMSRNVVSIGPKMNIYFVAGMFLNDTCRRFPVVVDGKLVGAITRFDILKAIRKNLDDPLSTPAGLPRRVD